ncbi:MAG: phosphoribosylaminoimidazolesuccinocarboxamide synthase [Apilactobacillus sp.]|uniref:phosphoribosylaminoimidazolesuccinocarboxamide synthase n=1 Tax=Apilactobacillus TaxID=2767877 RepID=UPI0025D89181|nr:phosphoribosylaminoimidazolesuccinocarboxamide synthase [Apilactobacillus sp.]MCT6822967.1 phosphoribosylaminoimidazolesuccinocarboxamide synthase [Apilactobacillus sp.]MCT6857979.1 phosphoribosylaminoimidazolesuccinocarboxamide synthase [Apilactobacillus sp.]
MTTLVTSGKTKELYTTENDNVLRAHYTDHTTAGDGLRNELIDNKGAVNNQISSLIFGYLNQNGVATHFIEQVSETSQLNKKVEMIPLEVVVRNFAAGHFQKRFGTDYLQTLKQPVVEFFYKDNDLHDPIVTKSDAVGLDLLSAEKLEQLEAAGLKVNQVLTDLFNKMNVTLVDFKLEFGINTDGEIILADEISPDSCRLLDKDTNESLDKDVFRKQTGDMMPGYLEILHRLQKAI